MRLLVPVLLSLLSSSSVTAQTYTISTFAGGALPVNVVGTSADLGPVWPQQTAADPAGNLYFAYQNAVLKWDAHSGLVTLFAGNGVAGDSGDDGPATSAELNSILGLATDSQGNLYIADTQNSRVKKVINGVISLVAGNGQQGFWGVQGDNGPATSAALGNTRNLAVDSSGNLYMADIANNVVRKVSNGIITTVAGNGTSGFSGDNGPATSAQLNLPIGVAVDPAGNLYISDYNNHRIRKVTFGPGGGVITTVAGTGTAGRSGDNGPAAQAQLHSPLGISCDPAGNLYIADTGNYVVRKVTNGVITTVAGTGSSSFSGDNGPPLSAGMSPSSVTVDSAGNLFVSDGSNHRIRKVANGVITTVVGGGTSANGGPATAMEFGSLQSVAVNSTGDVYIADGSRDAVFKVSHGVISTAAGTGTYGSGGDGGPATSATFGEAIGVAVDSADNLYILDYSYCNVRKVTNGIISTVVGGNGCGYSGDGGPALSAQLGYPRGIAVDSAGSIYIADYNNSVIRKVANGTITTVAGNGTSGYSGDNGPATSAQLSYPLGVAVDGAGNIYIADGNNVVRQVSNGTITTFAGSTPGFSGDNGPAAAAQVNYPSGVAVDSSGNLYIADTANSRVRVVKNGVISTIAGGGTTFGDDVPATSVQLPSPTALAITPAGNIYVADSASNSVRLLSPLAADLAISKSHTGNFSPGQAGATYSVTVSNSITAGITSSTVTVVDTLPSGLTLVSMSGTGWSCTDNNCTRSDALEPGSSYPAITVTVNVAADAPTQVTNQVTVSGGGSPSASASDPTSIGTPPAAVTVFAPNQGATGVAVTQSLTWTPPAGTTSYSVYFGTSSPPPQVVASAAATTYSPAMTAGTIYYWSITAINSYGSTPSAVWSFTTAGSPPAAVTVFSPTQGATGVAITQALTWTAPAGATSYSVYFGTSSPPPQAVASTTATTYSPSMNAGTLYYWSVTAINSSGSTPSAIWSFTTAGPPPAAVTVFSPSQGATSVAVTQALTWTAPAGATSYSINFGTSSPPPQVVASTTATTYSPTMTAGTTYYWAVTAINAFGSTPSAVWHFTTATATVSGYRFVPVTPCRVLDTRNATGTFGGPIMGAASTRTVPIPQSTCNIPSTAQAYSLNITVVPPGPLAYLTAWPAGQTQPVVSTLNSYDGRIVANAAIVPAGANQAIEFFASDATHVIADINGYFAPLSTANSMSFYAATPCRVVDTRNAAGPFGGPFLGAGSTRSFAIPSSACGIPATAQAYSLNVTVAPHGGLGYLTMWPTGQTQPYVSTLNSQDGSVVANAAIVPAGTPNGSVSVFATDATDVIIDINGYFAPPGSANALSLYTLTPCRVADTRQAAGAFGGPSLGAGGTRSFALASSACSVPTAPAYSLNVTVVPPGPLAYLTAWPAGQTQPYVSTLNSYAGKVVANAAIVPAGANGGVSVFVSDATNVILDINAYFAQ